VPPAPPAKTSTPELPNQVLEGKFGCCGQSVLARLRVITVDKTFPLLSLDDPLPQDAPGTERC